MPKLYLDKKVSKNRFITEIPLHWQDVPFRSVCKVKSVQGVTGEDLLSVFLNSGVVRYTDTNGRQVHKPSEDLSKYQLVEPRDLVFNNQQAWRGSVGVSTYRGIVSPAYIVMSLDKSVNERFIHYFIRDRKCTAQFVIASKGVGSIQRILDVKKLKTAYLSLPPREEQDQIVRYLDWQTSRIDKLINAKKKQISLLEEQKTCVINDAVTKGLLVCNHKRVQANWLAEIPQHWEFDKVKQHFHIKKEIAGKEGYDVLSITQQGLKVKDISTNEGQMAASYAKYQFVHPGDFAMNHMDLLTGYIGLSDRFGVTSPDYRVFVLDDTAHCDPEYFLHVFQLAYKRKIFYGLGQGAANKGRWRMPAENFKNFDIPVPPLDEQRKIVAYIKEQTAKIDKLIPMLDKQIDILQEYRVRLVSDVVTGQVNVRNIVIPEYGRIEEYNIKSEILTDTEDTTEDV